jgi:hypothetical protein
MVTPREILDIIVIGYYIPTLVISVIVSVRHGFGRQLGWVFLALLAVIRLVGGATGIASIHKPSEGLIATSVILNSVGLSPMLLAMAAMLKRV